MNHRTPLLLACAALVLGCGPKDGVLKYAFALEPISVITLPSTDDIGATIKASSFATTKGKVSGDLQTNTLQVTFEGFPHAHLKREKAVIELTLVVGPEAITPQGGMSGMPGMHSMRLLFDALSPVGVAHANAGHNVEVQVGEIDADDLGRVSMAIEPREDLPLDRVIAGHVDLILGIDSETPRTYKILDGAIGNLPSTTDSTTPAPSASGGHTH